MGSDDLFKKREKIEKKKAVPIVYWRTAFSNWDIL